MGKEAQVEAFWPDGGEDSGRLQYEPPKLVFRGAERRVFQGEALVGVRADGRDLLLPDGARFRLPTPAATWVEAIAHPKGRLEKLGVKPGLRVGIANLEDPAFAAEAGAVCEVLDGEAAALDLLVYGADSATALADVPRQLARLAPRGALWIVSLKGKAAQVRDGEVIAAGRAAGLVDTKVVAFSGTRTALKFVRRKS